MVLELSRHGRLSVVHMSKHSLFSWCWNSEDHGRLPYPSFHFLHSAGTLKTTVGCLTSKWPSIRKKPVHTSWTPWSALQKKRKLWARPPVLTLVPSQAIHSSPPIQTGKLLGPYLKTILKNWHSCWTPWSVFRNNNDGKTEKTRFFCVTVWEPWSLGLVWLDVETQAWAQHTRQPTRETTERRWDVMQVAIFGGVNAVQHHKPSAERCTAASWTSEVRIPELAACQSAPA